MKLAVGVSAGLDVVVSLLEKEEAAQLDLARESDVAEAKGLQFISFPIPDRGVPTSMPASLGLLKNIADALEHGKNVAVHCRQGIGRSGLISNWSAGCLRHPSRQGYRRLLVPHAD